TPVWRALLAEHRSFLPAVRPLLASRLVKAMAHVTGGGLPGNVPRSLPPGTGVRLERGAWEVPPVSDGIGPGGGVGEAERYGVFDVALGCVVVVAAEAAAAARSLGPGSRVGGEVVAGGGVELA